MTRPAYGDRATCAACGTGIWFDGVCWLHDGVAQPRHIATPAEPAPAPRPLKPGATAVPELLPEYAAILPALRAEARRHGYALTLHGSGQRDLDLVAVPWVAQVSPAAELAEALRAAVGGFVRNDLHHDPYDERTFNPVARPHGRLAWSIYLDEPSDRRYIDLSVMPALDTL